MISASPESTIDQIGRTAGLVWHTLQDAGPQSLTRLVKGVEAPRDTVILAIGWLAREGKVTIEETKRGRVVSLRG